MKTLYIIHGWTYTVEPWKETIEILKNDGIKVKMLHVPGLTEESKKVFTIKDYTKWADEQIPDGAIALGHSNGGRILLNLLSKKPEKLSHLILLDAAGIYEESKKRDIKRIIAKIGKPLKKIPLMRKIFHKIIGANDYDRAPENMKKTLTNMLESDKTLDISNIKTKTSILWGEADKITPPRQAKKLHEKLENSTLKFHKNWTHAPYICDPKGLAKDLEKILKEQN